MDSFEITVSIKNKKKEKMIKKVVQSLNQEQAQSYLISKLQEKSNGALKIYEVINIKKQC